VDIAEYQTTVDLNPNHAQAQNNFANALAARGRCDEALEHYRRAADLLPDDARTLNNLVAALTAAGLFDEALIDGRKALEMQPNNADIHCQLGIALAGQGRFREALAQYRESLKLNPKHTRAHGSLAWLQATCPQAAFRNGVEAIEHAQQASQLLGGKQPSALDALAAAYAEAGWFPEALGTAHQALDLAVEQHDQRLAAALRARIARYEAKKPYRQSPPATAEAPPNP
jgi:tetratricopeptide (TPR) repeat protein